LRKTNCPLCNADVRLSQQARQRRPALSCAVVH
jgi:hypothetical protein